ncbi:hypothetical protein As57867_004374, partial [Aphanomyces stellatus]
MNSPYTRIQSPRGAAPDDSSFSGSPNSDDVEASPASVLRISQAPSVAVVAIDRIQTSAWGGYNVFVLELTLPGRTWRTRTTIWALFWLALRGSNRFPYSLLCCHYRAKSVSDATRAKVAAYVTSLVANDRLWGNPRLLAFLGVGATRFDPLYGDSLVEGYVRMRHVSTQKRHGRRRRSCVGPHYPRGNVARLVECSIGLGLCFVVPTVIYFFFSLTQSDPQDMFSSSALINGTAIGVPVLIVTSVLYHRWLHRRKWMVVKPSCVAFFNDLHSTVPTHVILFQPNMVVADIDKKSIFRLACLRWMNQGIHVASPAALLDFYVLAASDTKFIRQVLDDTVAQCIYSTSHKHTSFAPVRDAHDQVNRGVNETTSSLPNRAASLVDGEETFASMFAHLQQAKTQIFITGWWITPDYALVRTSDKARDESTLVRLLQDAAARGVQVYVLIYKEHKFVLPNDSQHARDELRGPNIHVSRHPEFYLVPQMWSHHEKIVVIDQSVAFVGGLDIALGRYDSPAHDLVDSGPQQTWTGQDYSNPRVRDFVDVANHRAELIDREAVPRMPWHDIHCRLEGPVALDVAHHFILRWNFTVENKVVSIRSPQRPMLLPFAKPIWEATDYALNGSGTDAVNCQIVRSLCQWSGGIATEKSIQEAYIDLIRTAQHFIYIENQFFVSGFEHEKNVANRVVDALYHRIVAAHEAKQTFRVMFLMPLLPSFEGAVTSSSSASLRAVMHWQYTTICRGGNSLLERLAKIVPDPSQYVAFFGLRQHAMLGTQVVTEMIYIHSKLMIVDDRMAII